MSSLPLDSLSRLPQLESSSRVTSSRVEEPTDTDSFQEHLDQPQVRIHETTGTPPEKSQASPAESGEETDPTEQQSLAESETREQAEAGEPNEDYAEEDQAVRSGTPTPLVETLAAVPSTVARGTPTDTSVTSEEIAIPIDTESDVAVPAAKSAEITTLTIEPVPQQTKDANLEQPSAASLKRAKPIQAGKPNEPLVSTSARTHHSELTEATEETRVNRGMAAVKGVETDAPNALAETHDPTGFEIKPLSASSNNQHRPERAQHVQGELPVLAERGSIEDTRGASSESVAEGFVAANRPSRTGPALLRAEPSANDQANGPQQARFVQRVTKAFEVAKHRGEPIRLRLHPPELGSLRLEVKIDGNVMVARIEAETQTARTLLIDNLPVLRERLAEQEIRLEQFDIDLLDRQSANPDYQHEARNSEEQAEEPDNTGEQRNDNSTRASTRRAAAQDQADGRLDVRV